MADVTLQLVGFRERVAELTGAPGAMRKEMRKALRQIGNTVRRIWRRQFAGRLTDPRSRRRKDKGPALGRFSGKASRAIGVRVRIGRERMAVYVGPRGGAGIPGPGFYLAFHEYGARGAHIPRRPTAALADALARPGAVRELEAALDRVLGGW